MEVVEVYSFNGGLKAIKQNHPDELWEVVNAIRAVNPAKMRTKISKEGTMLGKRLFSPVALNKAILDNNLYKKGWTKPRIALDDKQSFIEGDGVKNRVGLEIQFGKYAFLGWDIFGKMPIFAKNKDYKVGIEVVPSKLLQNEMSSGVGSFTHIVNILKKRGISDVDIPVLILGISQHKSKENKAYKELGIK